MPHRDRFAGVGRKAKEKRKTYHYRNRWYCICTAYALLAKSPMVAEMCKSTGFAFGQRLQVLLWDNERAV